MATVLVSLLIKNCNYGSLNMFTRFFFVAYIDVQRLKAIFLELGLCFFFF